MCVCEKIHGSSLPSWKKLIFEATFHSGELKLQPDNILTMITLHLGRCHKPLCCFYGPWASTHSQYCRQAIIRLGALNPGTDVAARLLAKNKKKMPCTRANHRLLLCWGFYPVSHFWQWWETGDFRKWARNLRARGNCNKISYWTDTKQHQSQGCRKGKRLTKCLSFWQLDRTIYYIYS